MIYFGLLRPSFQKLELLGEHRKRGQGGKKTKKAAEDALVEIFGFTRRV